MARRYAIIIGAMKSGTTTLFDMLARHPAIAPASDKEPGFFAFDDVRNRGFDWFDTLFDFDPGTHVYRLEASTDYTKAPFVTGVWERMTSDPDVEVKLIYIMRNPLRRIESHARHTQQSRREIGREISDRPDHSLDTGISPVNLAVSHYADQLGVYAGARAAGRLHCLTLEELRADPAGTMAKVWDFLGLPAPEQNDLTHSNPRDRRRVSPVWARLTAIRPVAALGKALLPGKLRRTLRDWAKRPVRTEGRFTLNAAEIEELSRLYAPDLDRLEAEYGIPARRLWRL